ncbi:uncharacterized protein LOC131616186 [Vicia villosa]|uniref:uncharacterized protein LOC131616186 n=1 Tax=Vicia villosa TaxID=3911 RepID=UPI00273CE610|nr:uncharacterized protein LOC131616186 [Vicia villosa]
MSKMSAQKKHIEQIRREKYSIGGNANPLTKDLHQAVMNLSNELYTRDVHFLMELIQNAEDNHYSEEVNPTLEFIITSKDITATGAPATLLIFNNETGFSRQNIESICSVGQSTKKGNRNKGYIGEKGIGFKSVFLVTAQPYIFSNGYQIRFNEKPCPNCKIGYIVPEWVEEKPTLSDIKQVYGADKDSLPATTIILPLKLDKIDPVKEQLSSIHPEVLLFLSKIKHLSVKEDNENPKKNTVTSVSISSKVNFVTRKNMNAESYTINLSAGENRSNEKECSYFMWKQKFPVKLENMVERRMDMEECVVTLAFPQQERLHRGKKTRKVKVLPGVYAYLPTQMVTNFPFIIQADFVLASSRETIVWGNKWNQGILEYVPSAFVNAFKTLVTGIDEGPVSSLLDMFRFLPINGTPLENFNHVIEKIQVKLAEEKIVPIETFTDKTHFYKASEVSRLNSQFWKILTTAQEEEVYLRDLFSHEGMKILSSSFDKGMYDTTLKFLGVKTVKFDWYANCIQSSNLLDGLSEKLYVQLLLFVAKHKTKRCNIDNIPLIKYAASDGFPYFFTIEECKQQGAGSKRVVLAADISLTSWLIDWNKALGCAANHFFMPESTQQAISKLSLKKTDLSSKKILLDWLEKEVEIHTHNVYNFAKVLSSFVEKNSKLSIAYAHFLYHSVSKGYLSSQEVDDLCSSMPLVDRQGRRTKTRQGVLLPANVSKWANLMVSNPWRNENYVELGKGYLNASSYAGQSTDSGGLIEFLKTHVKASDIPNLSPPNAGFSAADTPLTKDNAFLLLDWIRDLKHKGVPLPERFLECIKEGNWLKVSGSRYISPSKSFLIGSELGKLLQNKSVLITIPLIDESFYGERIYEYKAELETIGVMFNCEEACGFIGKELMSLAASNSLSRNDIFVMLKFIKYHRESLLPLDKYLDSIRKESWLKTSCGLRSPVGSVLNDSAWQVALQISNIPLINDAYYGEEIYNYKEELKLLGVKVEISGNYQAVVEHLKSPSNLTSLTAEAIHLMLECIRHLNAPAPIKLLILLQGTSCLKTNLGFKTPGECFLYDRAWGCILEVFDDLPVIDHTFYGEKIFSYKHELRQIGVVVDFVYAIEKFALIFEEKASDTSISKQQVMSFLTCCRRLEGTKYSFSSDLSIVIQKTKWLQTSVGDFRCPKKCILYGPEWESISSIACLPFIDIGIQEYKAELKRIGVITELKDGFGFVAECLNFPSDPSSISPESVFSLLECIQLLMQDSKFTIEGDFRKRLSGNWLKTLVGYRPPEKCLLFDSKWSSFLNLTDGPFIDENFYGPSIASFQKELNAIGVINEVEKGCSLLASHIESLCDHDTIVKIYKYLYKHNWKPEKKAARKIWILDGNKDGKWVDFKECIVHDPAKLFGSKFYVLEDIYHDSSIHLFFFITMDVKNQPSVEDYVELWNDWGMSMEQLPYDACCKFWTSISKHLSTNEEKELEKSLMKLPTTSGNDEIFLVDKEDAFIPDNIHMKKLFEKEKVFVWYPQYNMKQLSKSELSDFYRRIGVRNISESLCKEESSSVNDGGELNYVDPNNIFNLKGLVKLILGFLACDSLKMEPKTRHEAVQKLVNSSFHEANEPINVSYSLSLSSGDIITKKANKRARWESQNCKFIIHKIDAVPGEALKCATSFSEAVSEGILRENHDHLPALIELISLGFVLKFKSEEIDFLMDSKNLHLDPEDEEFLSSAFPYD